MWYLLVLYSGTFARGLEGRGWKIHCGLTLGNVDDISAAISLKAAVKLLFLRTSSWEASTTNKAPGLSFSFSILTSVLGLVKIYTTIKFILE